jgi:SAM-dependent methyltransferase
MNGQNAEELKRIYEQRFEQSRFYRSRVWRTLVQNHFQKYINQSDVVLDLGCGYGDFINQVRCGKKYGMDLNPDARNYLSSDVELIEQDCSAPWPLKDKSLHVVFTSNFFEHLSDKRTLGKSLDEIFRCLRPHGKLIAMGPNIKYLPGEYWDFWDHYLPLTEMSLAEGLTNRGFEIVEQIARFLPYTMVGGRAYPDVFLKAYLRMRFAWRFLGKQFVVVATKPG